MNFLPGCFCIEIIVRTYKKRMCVCVWGGNCLAVLSVFLIGWFFLFWLCVCVKCVSLLTISSPWTVHCKVCGLVRLQSGSFHSRTEHLHLVGVAAFTYIHLSQEITWLILIINMFMMNFSLLIIIMFYHWKDWMLNMEYHRAPSWIHYIFSLYVAYYISSEHKWKYAALHLI